MDAARSALARFEAARCTHGASNRLAAGDHDEVVRASLGCDTPNVVAHLEGEFRTLLGRHRASCRSYPVNGYRLYDRDQVVAMRKKIYGRAA
ncbi:MAG TPA: hypothetical protein VHC69_31150 [Polyangiaceae bacterium]|nr:hypothetical protein [Polyangiaceae bacterium]